MAKKPTEKQLYKLKNEWLGQFFEEVKPKEFYRAVFPEGSFERAGHFEDGKVRLRRKSSSAIMARKGRENQPFFKRSKMCNKLY